MIHISARKSSLICKSKAAQAKREPGRCKKLAAEAGGDQMTSTKIQIAVFVVKYLHQKNLDWFDEVRYQHY
jgi:hypothetical protein